MQSSRFSRFTNIYYSIESLNSKRSCWFYSVSAHLICVFVVRICMAPSVCVVQRRRTVAVVLQIKDCVFYHLPIPVSPCLRRCIILIAALSTTVFTINTRTHQCLTITILIFGQNRKCPAITTIAEYIIIFNRKKRTAQYVLCSKWWHRKP